METVKSEVDYEVSAKKLFRELIHMMADKAMNAVDRMEVNEEEYFLRMREQIIREVSNLCDCMSMEDRH